ncbi:MAG TPA: MFS transporter [Thermomicrobiales bacterium]|nr:MFS transporter [Thermomicrobiales bacterium]
MIAALPVRRDRKPLLALIISMTISLIGSQFTLIALPWFVLTTTGSAAKAGLVGFAELLPALAVGIFGGVYVDRIGFKRVSVIADVVSGLGIVAIPLLYDTIGLAFWQLLVLVFIGSLLNVPSVTAHRSMVPELAALAGIPLARVNGFVESLRSLATLLGTPLAGFCVAWLGARQVLWLDAASFAFSAALVALLVPGAYFLAKPAIAANGYVKEVFAGLKFIRKDQLLWPMVIVLALMNALTGSIGGLVLPVYAREEFGSAASLGVMLAATGAGAFLGSTLYGVFAERLSRTLVWVVAFLLMPFELWIFTLSPSVPVLVVVFLAGGIISGPLNPLMVTIRMERSPEALRGRVFSTYSAVAGAAQPLGMLVIGNMIQGAGFTPAVVATAICAQTLGIVVILIPAFRRMDALREDRPVTAPAASRA